MGEVFAQTASAGSFWYVAALFNCISPSSEIGVARSIAVHMLQSTQWNNAELAMQRQANANDYVNSLIGPHGSITNWNNVIDHYMNQVSSIVGDEPVGSYYEWTTPGGETILSNSYENPTDDSELTF